MTRRNIRKRIRDLDGVETARKWPKVVEIACVSATKIDEDGENTEGNDRDDPDSDERDDEEFTIRIPIPPNDEVDKGADETPVDCPTAGCPNTVIPPLDICEACAGMPSRDWREETRDPETVDYE